MNLGYAPVVQVHSGYVLRLCPHCMTVSGVVSGVATKAVTRDVTRAVTRAVTRPSLGSALGLPLGMALALLGYAYGMHLGVRHALCREAHHRTERGRGHGEHGPELGVRDLILGSGSGLARVRVRVREYVDRIRAPCTIICTI